MNPRRDWDQFWFDPIGGTSLAVFRFLFGLSCIVGLAMLWPDRVLWFTDQGPITYAVMQMLNSLGPTGPVPYSPLGPHLSELGISVYFIGLMLASLSLSLGFCSRTSALIVSLGLNALQHRNNQIMNGADVVYTVMSFYLILAPAGAVFSVDRLIRLARGKDTEEPKPIIPWAQRLIQIQVSFIYLAAVMNKVTGSLWVNGTAVYYPMNFPELIRFPLPHLGLDDMWIINLLTFGTMAVEFSLVFLVWHPRLRLYVLAAGVMMHLGIEYALNVPFFSGMMITCYISFINDDDWKKLKRAARRKFAYAKLVVTTNGVFKPLALKLLRRFDPLDLIQYKEDPNWTDSESLLRADDARGGIALDTMAVTAMASRMPFLWPCKLVSWFPGGSGWAHKLESALVQRRPAEPQPVEMPLEPISS